MCKVLVLVYPKLDFAVKEVIMAGNVYEIVRRWRYKYGKLFYKCSIWVELDDCSKTLNHYLETARLRGVSELVKPKSKIIYGKFLGNVGMGKVSSPPKSAVN